MAAYLKNVVEGRLPPNNDILYNIQSIVNLLPNLSVETLVKSMLVSTNDMHLVRVASLSPSGLDLCCLRHMVARLLLLAASAVSSPFVVWVTPLLVALVRRTCAPFGCLCVSLRACVSLSSRSDSVRVLVFVYHY